MINFAFEILLRIKANKNPSHIVKRKHFEEDALVKNHLTRSKDLIKLFLKNNEMINECF